MALLAKDRIISNNAKSFLKGIVRKSNSTRAAIPHFNRDSNRTSLRLTICDDACLFFTVLELILRRDPRLAALLKKFESKEAGDSAFLEKIHELIRKSNTCYRS